MTKVSGLGARVGALMSAMHQYDRGDTLPLLYAARLTTPQLAALEFVRTPRSVSAVAAHLGLSLPATSQTVERLVRLRYAVRRESAVDRRIREVAVAPAGLRLLERIAQARAARFERSLKTVSRKTAHRLFDALGDAIRELEAGAV